MDKIIAQEKRHNRTIVGYIIAFILLLLSYFITLYANNQLLKQMGMVSRSYQIINNVERMISEVKDAETSIRGYIISKDLAFLTPYYGSKEKVDSICRMLLETNDDNPAQKVQLEQVHNYINNRYEILDYNLRSFKNNNRQVTDSMIKLQPQQLKVMNDIRATVNTIKREETLRLNQRDVELKTILKSLNTITFVSLILAISLIVFGAITFIRESRARKKALYRIREYQEKLQQRIDELNAANSQLIEMRSMEKFTATGRIARTIAHEVRNPLTNINLAADQLKTELIPDDENAAFLFDMITRNSNRINHLISDLLNSTKFSELNYETISINDLIDDTLTEAADRIKLNNIIVEKNYSPDICNVSGDKTKLKIAFLNIVINAVEAMESTENRVLKIITKSENNKCKIEVGDSGTGLDDESISRLFEPYFTSKPKGNGLGLTNTQNIILNHKGSINVKSKKGMGTSFIIILDFAT